jgi:hypothetical protein
MAGSWTRIAVLGFASVLTFVSQCWAFLIAVSCIPSTLLLSKCQTKANQWHLSAVTSPDLDLCSLITILDHLVLIPLEERAKTFETVYIAAIAAVNSLRSRRRFHVLSAIHLLAIQ